MHDREGKRSRARARETKEEGEEERKREEERGLTFLPASPMRRRALDPERWILHWVREHITTSSADAHNHATRKGSVCTPPVRWTLNSLNTDSRSPTMMRWCLRAKWCALSIIECPHSFVQVFSDNCRDSKKIIIVCCVTNISAYILCAIHFWIITLQVLIIRRIISKVSL